MDDYAEAFPACCEILRRARTLNTRTRPFLADPQAARGRGGVASSLRISWTDRHKTVDRSSAMTRHILVGALCAAALSGLALTEVSAQPTMPVQIPEGAAVFIQNSEFGQALSAAILKKKVPVVIVTDREKADYYFAEVSNATKEGTAERVTKVLVFGIFAGSGKTFEASVNCTNRDGVVVFARNTSKPSIKAAAEDVASKLKDHITGD
jgi:hypothetical protein